MSAEHRVTDERLAVLCDPNIHPTARDYWHATMGTIDILASMCEACLDLRDSRTAHRATEAKLRAALAEVERLKADNKGLTDHLEECVQDRLSEINAEAEAFDKECWNALRSVCESRPEFDWRDYDDHLTADDAAQFLYEEFRVDDRALARATAAESALAATKAKLEAAEAVLRVVHEQFECPARNTNRGRAYREGVLVSNDVREMVSAAIATKEAPDATAE